MKKINIDSQQTHFIGSWNLENKKLCNEIISFFENNKNLQKPGVSGKGKDPKIKKTTDIRINPNDLKIPKFKIFKHNNIAEDPELTITPNLYPNLDAILFSNLKTFFDI